MRRLQENIDAEQICEHTQMFHGSEDNVFQFEMTLPGGISSWLQPSHLLLAVCMPSSKPLANQICLSLFSNILICMADHAVSVREGVIVRLALKRLCSLRILQWSPVKISR